MAPARGRRATSLQPTSYNGGAGFSSSVNSNRLSRLNSQQDSYSSSSTYSTSTATTPRTRRVSDIDSSYASSASNGGGKASLCVNSNTSFLFLIRHFRDPPLSGRLQSRPPLVVIFLSACFNSCSLNPFS